jgi:two-component system nitrogen regulation response regulator GlnG
VESQTSVLLVDDDPEIAQAVVNYLPANRYRVEVVGDGAVVLDTLRRFKPDIVLLDVHLPGASGLDLLREIKNETPGIPVVIVSGYISTGNAIEAMKDGAYEYLTKPFRLDQLEKTIARAIGAPVQQTVTADTDVPLTDDQLIGKSPEIVQVAKIIGQVSGTDAPVLMMGETGTGKELVARLIHKNSSRRNRPFVTVNCASTDEILLEADLFGHERGLNPSQPRKTGRFEHADGGTVFLDEVADLPLGTQSKLLRLLQQQTFERLNGDDTVSVDVRMIAATNRSLVDLMKEGRFRVDLFSRLKVVSLFLPPLRERKSDILLLSDFFVKKYARICRRPPKPLSVAAQNCLMRHLWPGNVRELENAIHTAVVLSKEAELLPEDFPMIADARQTLPLDFDQIHSDYAGLFQRAIEPVFDRIAATSEGHIHSELTAALEQTLVETALKATGNNQVRAAQLLGISRNTLRDRVRRFELANPVVAPQS